MLRYSASAGDVQYLLRSMDHTTFRFRVKRQTSLKVDGFQAGVYGFVQSRPGVTVNEIWAQVPALKDKSYNDVRALVVGMVDKGMLGLAGQAPLEEVDGRYERVAACDLCGSASTGHKIVLWKYNTPVVRCSQCGVLYANPRWKAEHLFGRYTEEYWEHYADTVRSTAFDPAANQARWDPYLDSLEPVRRTGRLLDVGCATGEFLAAAKSRGWNVYGVETSRIGAEQAERLTGAEVYVGTLETASYQDGWFDAVTLWDVIEHVQSPSSYVERIERLVRIGGMFALTTPNIRSISYKLLGRDWWVVGPNDHIYYFAPRTMARLLKGYGFGIHEMHTFETNLETWQHWLKYPAFQRFAPQLHKKASPIAARFLLGDELYVVGRRKRS